MNVVVGKQFESLKQKAIKYVAKDLDYSNQKIINVLKHVKMVEISIRHEDFLIRKDKYRRKNIEKEQVK